MSDIVERITEYLSGGGLFNPEHANHDAVRDLLTDCRAELAATVESGWLIELKETVPSWAVLNPEDYDEHWTTDSTRAIRFAREADAQAYIDHIGWTEAFPSEHIWDDGRRAALAPATEGRLPQIKHLKRGSTYDVIGEGEVQISSGEFKMTLEDGAPRVAGGAGRVLCEGDTLVAYRAHSDGKLWLRFPDEFNDGRFEALKPEGES